MLRYAGLCRVALGCFVLNCTVLWRGFDVLRSVALSRLVRGCVVLRGIILCYVGLFCAV
jgi:hypothetical protein